MVEQQKQKIRTLKSPAVIRQWLKWSWLTWLGYRLVLLPVLVHMVSHRTFDMMGGMVWQGIWLVPAFVMTYWLIKGTSPYALLLSSMLTLVYLGASGVNVLVTTFEVGFVMGWIYLLDFLWLLVINIALFFLLKRLPSMNKNSSV